MKITGMPAISPATGGARVEAVERVASAAGAAAAGSELQSAVLQEAIGALREMPDMDQAKVAALREALARGEIVFDAAKLAGLIERHHGSRG